MKEARIGAAVALWNNKIIICGGSIDDTTVTGAEYYNPGDNRWIECTDLPTAIGAHSLVTYENKFILFGGGTNEVTNAVWELDPQESNSKWKSLPPLKYPSACFAGIILDQEIYAIGGLQKVDLVLYILLSRVEIFDGERWRDGAALPYTWSFMSSVIIPQTLSDRLCHYKRINPL